MRKFNDKNYYNYLQIPPDADQHTISAAFQNLTNKNHLGDSRGDEEKLKKLVEVYSILSDETSRREYDDWLKSQQMIPEGAEDPGYTSTATGTDTNPDTEFCTDEEKKENTDFKMGFPIDWKSVRKKAYQDYDEWRESLNLEDKQDNNEREEEKNPDFKMGFPIDWESVRGKAYQDYDKWQESLNLEDKQDNNEKGVTGKQVAFYVIVLLIIFLLSFLIAPLIF